MLCSVFWSFEFLCSFFIDFFCARVYFCFVLMCAPMSLDVFRCRCMSVHLCMCLVLVCLCTTFIITREPEQVQLWELQTHTWHPAATIKKPIDDSDPSLWEMEREGWRRGDGRREAVDEMFLLCFTASDTDPSVNKSFTLACIQPLFRYGPLSSFPSNCMPSSPPSALHSHVYRAITGCDAQVRSWPPTSCRAEVDSGHIFLCLVFSAFYLWGLSCGTLTTMSQHRASHTNWRHSCVFWTCNRQASNCTRENICSKCQSFVSVAMSSSSVLLQTKHTAVYFLKFSHSEEHSWWNIQFVVK